MYQPILRVIKKKKKSANDLSNGAYVFFCIFFSDFLYKSICLGAHLN